MREKYLYIHPISQGKLQVIQHIKEHFCHKSYTSSVSRVCLYVKNLACFLLAVFPASSCDYAHDELFSSSFGGLIAQASLVRTQHANVGNLTIAPKGKPFLLNTCIYSKCF